MLRLFSRSAPAHEVDGPMSPLRMRDALVSWFMEQAEPQIRKGLRFTSGKVSEEEVRRVAHRRAVAFFQGLRSTYDRPTFDDLRQVKVRMDQYLPAPARQFPHEMLL